MFLQVTSDEFSWFTSDERPFDSTQGRRVASDGSQNGFTLMELLLTIVVISVGMLGIMSLFENATRGALQADVNVIATNLIHEKLEQIVLAKVRDGYASLGEASYPPESFFGDLSVYSRSTSVREVAESDFSTSSPGSGYKRVEVTVSWGPADSERIMIPMVLADY